jgi:hypothetical protein
MTVRVDAPPTRLLRPLPRPVRPMRNETLSSYLRRIASANRLDSDELRSYVAADNHKRARVPLDRLAVLSGQPRLALQRAIFEFWPPAGDPAEHGRPSLHSPERIACTLCMARRDVRSVAIVRLNVEDLLCQRHLRWLGDSSRSIEDNQPALATQPDIVKANRLHRLVIRRHGRTIADAAFRDAQEVCAGWRRRCEHNEGFQQLMSRFHPGQWRAFETDPTVEAAAYPQTVALTRILASPTLREMPFYPAGVDRFAAEVRRTVAPDFRWNATCSYGHYDPLIEIYIDEARRRRCGDPPRRPLFLTPARRAADQPR